MNVFWSNHGEDTLVISALMISTLGLYLLPDTYSLFLVGLLHPVPQRFFL